MLDRIRRHFRSNRALSPAVSAVFLMGIILAAIGIALGIIYPQVGELNDDIGRINAGTAMISIDKDIKNLIINGEGGKISKSIEIGISGVLNVDLVSYSTISLNYLQNGLNPTNIGNYYERHNRFMITQQLAQDSMIANSHQYFIGSDIQSTFFLNNSKQGQNPWSIINQSRGSDDFVDTALSYRGLISTNKVIDQANSRIYLTVSIQMVELEFPAATQRSGHSPNVQLSYYKLNSTLTPYYVIYGNGNDNLFYLRTETLLDGSAALVEIPLTHEVPSAGSLQIRLEIITHHIAVTF